MKDHVMVITAIEGGGKSTFSSQMGAVLAMARYTIDSIAFEQGEFVDLLRTSQPGDVIHLDEGASLLFSRSSQSKGNVQAVKLMQLMRQLRLVTLICVPDFKSIDPYIRNHRVQTLVQLSSTGKGKIIVGDGIKILSEQVNKGMNPHHVKLPNGSFFHMSFNKHLPPQINREEYDAKKRKHLDDVLESIELSDPGPKEVPWVSITEATKIVPLSAKTYRKRVQEGKIPGRKVGGKWFVSREWLQQETPEKEQ
jgi:hypothetical protein